MIDWPGIIDQARNGNPVPPARVEKSPTEWQALLAPDVYFVARQSGTERPFSSEMCSLFEPGLYGCACCATPLFDATRKFESGTGWPSFTQPVTDNVVAAHIDESHGMVRVEVTCNVCDAHLGHVFPDGPAPSGLRYCINALSLAKLDKD